MKQFITLLCAVIAIACSKDDDNWQTENALPLEEQKALNQQLVGTWMQSIGIPPVITDVTFKDNLNSTLGPYKIGPICKEVIWVDSPREITFRNRNYPITNGYHEKDVYYIKSDTLYLRRVRYEIGVAAEGWAFSAFFSDKIVGPLVKVK